MKKKKLRKLIDELEKLNHQADERSKGLDEEAQYGKRELTEEKKARDAGYAGAYTYCILRLRELLED